MERSELLARLRFAPPEACRVRVIIDTDAKNEGDDDFAILHHLLTPQFDVRGICATHFEVKTTQRGLPPHSMERSYQEVCRLLNTSTMFLFFMVVLPLSPPRRMLPTVKLSSF